MERLLDTSKDKVEKVEKKIDSAVQDFAKKVDDATNKIIKTEDKIVKVVDDAEDKVTSFWYKIKKFFGMVK